MRVIDATTVGLSFGEAVTPADVSAVLGAFGVKADEAALHAAARKAVDASSGAAPGAHRARESAFMEHPVFNTVKSESQMLRYLKSLRART